MPDNKSSEEDAASIASFELSVRLLNWEVARPSCRGLDRKIASSNVGIDTKQRPADSMGSRSSLCPAYAVHVGQRLPVHKVGAFYSLFAIESMYASSSTRGAFSGARLFLEDFT